jgi:hypothetical protein
MFTNNIYGIFKPICTECTNTASKWEMLFIFGQAVLNIAKSRIENREKKESIKNTKKAGNIENVLLHYLSI